MSEKSCSSTCTSKDCKNCAKNNNNIQPEFHPDKNIKHVIAIASGKGGVGKSTVTALIARKLAKAGYKVGILDGDITGPSIPKMFGIYSGIEVTEKGMEPATSTEGIKIISMNLLLDNEEDPVLFRIRISYGDGVNIGDLPSTKEAHEIMWVDRGTEFDVYSIYENEDEGHSYYEVRYNGKKEYVWVDNAEIIE